MCVGQGAFTLHSQAFRVWVSGKVCLQGGAHDKHSRVREAAIHISQQTVRQQDRGVVIIGGSIERGDLTGQLLTACKSLTIPGQSCLIPVVSKSPLRLPSRCLLACLALWGSLLATPFVAALCAALSLWPFPFATVLLSCIVCIAVHCLTKVVSMAPIAMAHSSLQVVRLRLTLTIQTAEILLSSLHPMPYCRTRQASSKVYKSAPHIMLQTFAYDKCWKQACLMSAAKSLLSRILQLQPCN